MAAKEKSQDEKNLKLLRELAALPANKYCFDCQQRGPTYIDVTIGSFVCTSCSGILRGLNPPHRVKSITMASFTAEEMELIKSKGNEYCKCVWLGKYDPQLAVESEYQNVQKIRDFMVQKYEEKKYYVDPEIAVKKMKARAPSIPNTSVSQSKSQTNIQSKQNPLICQRPTWVSQSFSAGETCGRTADFFKDFGSDPFTSPPKSAVATESCSFADFSQAFGNSATVDTFSPAQAISPSSQFGGFASSPAFSTPSSISPPVAATTCTIQQAAAVAANKPSQKKPAPPPPDRYAALADLDNQLHHLQNQTVPANSTPVVTSVATSSPQFWSSSASAFGSIPSPVFASDTQNPFGMTTSTWTQLTQVVSVNPFQAVPQPIITNPLGNPTPVIQHQIPNGLPNPRVAPQPSIQNGNVTSTFWPSVSNPGWGTPFQNCQVDTFQNKNTSVADHYNPWAQALTPGAINPFVNGSGSSGVPAAVPRTNTGNNPFL